MCSRQPNGPRARESTSDCAAYNYVYYNTASAVPILSMLDPGRSHLIEKNKYMSEVKFTKQTLSWPSHPAKHPVHNLYGLFAFA